MTSSGSLQEASNGLGPGAGWGLVGWGVVVAAVLVWEVVTLAKAPQGWPSLSDLLRVVVRPVPGRWALFAVWLWVGWHLFVRGWQFFLGGPGPGAHKLGSGGSGFGRILAPAILPLLVVYLIFLAVLVKLGPRAGRDRARRARRGRRSWYPPPVWLLRYLAVLAVPGFVGFLVIATVLTEAAGEHHFFGQALSGGGFLAFGVAVPGFVVLTAGAAAFARLRALRRRHGQVGSGSGW